jgi:hypothetical protein
MKCTLTWGILHCHLHAGALPWRSNLRDFMTIAASEEAGQIFSAGKAERENVQGKIR